MEGYKVFIGKSKNIEREIYYGTLFYKKMDVYLIHSESNSILFQTEFLPVRNSMKRNMYTYRLIKENLLRHINLYDTKNSSTYNFPDKTFSFLEKYFLHTITVLWSFMDKLFLYKKWILLFKFKSEKKFNKIIPPFDRFWADPFIIKEKEKYFVFFEELIYSNKKGHIAVGELNIQKKKIERIQIILKDEFHYSFPFVFNYNDDWFMIPETHEKNKIELYKSKNFPYQWEKVRNILTNIDAADSVLHLYNDRFYLFTSIKQGFDVSHNTNLSIYVSDDLIQGEFKKIPDVKMNHTGLFNSRMAGSLVKHDEKWFRYSQNCEGRYGKNVQINEMIKLDEDTYEEVYVSHLNKPKFSLGMHTYNSTEDLVISDLEVIIVHPLKVVANKFIKLFLN